MVKICDDAIAQALKIIFDATLASGTYPTSWKKANVVPVHGSDLGRIAEWAHQFNQFNPDPNKQTVHKHLGLFLDKQLTFDHHLKKKISKANKGIALITRLRNYVPRDALIRIHKAFIRPHLDYGDIVYDRVL